MINLKSQNSKVVLSILVFGFIPFFIPSPSFSHDLIFAVKSSDIEPYNLALKGVAEVFKAKGLDSSIKVHDIKGDKGRWEEILKKIKEEKPGLIMTFGTIATELVKKDVKDTPIVFSTVLNPEESRIVNSFASPGGNVTGASLDIPEETQFSYILKVVPSTKRVGVLYNSKETGMVIERARAAAARSGLQLTTVEVDDETDLPKAMEWLLERIDVLWSVADGTVLSTPVAQKLIMEAIRYKIPFMGLSPSFVKAGALFSLKWDDADVGRQAGEAAIKVISGHEEISGISVTTPRNLSISINMNTARSIGIKIPDSVLKRAEVFK